jgi:hypothetical protein
MESINIIKLLRQKNKLLKIFIMININKIKIEKNTINKFIKYSD